VNHQRKITASLLATIAISMFSNKAFADSDPFYQALSKTQEQNNSLAAKELEIIGQQSQKRGDLANAYRSQAASILIRYNLDPYQYSTFNTSRTGEPIYGRPKWYHLESCWSNDRDGFSGGSCEFGIGWMEPPTNIKNFGGIVILDNKLASSSSKDNVRGILDTVVLPKLKVNESVVSSCEITSVSGKKQGVLALVTYNAKSKKFTKIRQAWYPNIQAKRLQAVDSKQVTCPIPYDPEG
jgi:ribosomal protein L28